MRSLIAVLALMVISVDEAIAQSVSSLQLGQSTGALTHEFSQVTSIRELGDGRVLIVDGRESAVFVGDFSSGSVRSVGRSGRGPKEYDGTSLLFALAGDSTVMVDFSRRWILFRSDEIVDARSPDGRLEREVRGFLFGTDSLGHALVLRSLPASLQGQTTIRDSIVVVLLDRRTARADTVASIRAVPSQTRTVSQGSGTMTSRLFMPFATGEEALLFPDGWIAVARLNPYRVDWLPPGGRLIQGAPLPVVLASVSATDRAGFVEANPARRGRPPLFDFTAFPEILPPFEYRAPADPALLVGTDGKLIIRRTVVASQSENLYDVVDRSGTLVGTIHLPKHSRLAGFGAASAFVIRSSDDGIQRVVRYRWQ